MRATSLLATILLALPAAAQVKGPQDITVQVGRLASVPLTVDGDESDYQVLGDQVDAFREYSPDPKQIRLRLIGYAPGTSYVVVSSQKAGKLQPMFTVKVTVVGAAPVPPPVPPTPPGPGPLDALASQFRAAFTASGFTKAKELAAGLDACRTLPLTTSNGAEFMAKGKAALMKALDNAPLPPAVQSILGTETAGVLPTDPARAWTAAEVTAAAALYSKLKAAVLAAGDATR